MTHGAMLGHGSCHTKGQDFPFDLGDAVAIYYQNLPENVEAVYIPNFVSGLFNIF